MTRTGLDAWMVRCKINVQNFKRDRGTMTQEQQIEFIRDQYTILSIISKLVNGEARLQGISRP